MDVTPSKMAEGSGNCACACNSLSHFENGWGRLTIRCCSKSKKQLQTSTGRFWTRTTPFWGFHGVPTSSRRYLWRRHLGIVIDVNQDLGRTFRSLLRRRRKMAALPLPAAILDDLIPGTGNWEWGHPRWRPEAERPPSCASASIGIEKFSLYY